MSQVATAKKTVPAPRAFRQTVTNMATALLSDWVGAERAGEAVGRVASALASAAASAKKPQEFYDCTPESIGAVVAISALTGIMPSTGANALAYAIPRRARQGEKPQLRYQLSHRGLAALARRSGQSLIAIPIGHKDVLDVDAYGAVTVKSRDIDHPPVTMDELRGVVVVVRDNATSNIIFAGYVPSMLIEIRRNGSDAFKFADSEKGAWSRDSDPWHKWPVEMAMKTAMHYAVGRGWCVIDDTEATRALAMDVADDSPVVEGHVERRISKLDDLTERLNSPTDPTVKESLTVEPDSPATPEEQAAQVLATVTDTLSGIQSVAQASEFAAMEIQAVQEESWPDDLKKEMDEAIEVLANARIEEIKSARGERSNKVEA